MDKRLFIMTFAFLTGCAGSGAHDSDGSQLRLVRAAGDADDLEDCQDIRELCTASEPPTCGSYCADEDLDPGECDEGFVAIDDEGNEVVGCVISDGPGFEDGQEPEGDDPGAGGGDDGAGGGDDPGAGGGDDGAGGECVYVDAEGGEDGQELDCETVSVCTMSYPCTCRDVCVEGL